MDKARKLAGDLLGRITKEGAYSGSELDRALFDDSLSPQDRSFVTELVYGTLSRLYSIDEIIKSYSSVKLTKMEDKVLSQLRLAVYQIKYLDRVPPFAAVSEAVTIVRKSSPKAAGFVNGILRSILREEKSLTFKNEAERLAFTYSLRPDLVRHFMKEFPDDHERVLAALIQPEGISIRINEKKISLTDYKNELTQADLPYREGWFSPKFVYLDRPGAVRSLPGYREGWFSVQNEAAALPPMLLSSLVEKGLVLDLCAAPGGKSAYLAEEAGAKLEVEAFDVSLNKLPRMQENFKRLGLQIKTRAADATEFLPEYDGRAQGVLLDVPCSGLGLLGRKPDIRLTMDASSMQQLVKIQRQILKNGARYVKAGGWLVYSTCTLNQAENRKNLEWFLKENQEFILLTDPLRDLAAKAREKGLDTLREEGGMLTVLPGRGLDGFFLALLQRRES